MITGYKELTAGDTRQLGDEVRRTEPYKLRHYTRTVDYGHDDKDFSDWQPCRLVGYSILPADLIVAEFRRPIG